MGHNKESANEHAKRMLEKDPDYYKKIRAKVTKSGGKHSKGSFKPGNKYAAMGGKASKRPKVKPIYIDSHKVEAGNFEYMEGDGGLPK